VDRIGVAYFIHYQIPLAVVDLYDKGPAIQPELIASGKLTNFNL